MLVCRKRSLSACCWSAVLAVFCWGCSGGTPVPEYAGRLVPVTGTVTLDGQPLAGASIVFHPDAKVQGGENAFGTTEPDGSYELQTIVVGHGPKPGAVPATYVVTIHKVTMPDGSPVPADMTDADAESEGAKSVVPARYTQMEQSPLKVEVAAGGGTHDFELRRGG